MSQEQTQMTADPKRSKMVAPGKTYKIQMVRDAEIETPKGERRIAKEGEVVEVTAACARELLMTKIKGMYTHAGESSHGELETIVRAKPFKGVVKKKDAEEGSEESLDNLYETS